MASGTTDPKDGLNRIGLWLKGLQFAEMRFWAALVVSIVGGVLWTRPPWTALLAGLVLGTVTWVVLEYLLHRFVLHLPAPKAAWLRKFHARLHWQHHQTPNEPGWLFVPWWATLTLYPTAAGVGFLVGNFVDMPLVLPTLLGFALTFGHYEATHLAAHVSFHPPTAFGQMMKRHHLLHHFKNERYWFGVTNPLMDLLFGTWKKRDDVPKSATARTLGIDPE